MKPQTYLPILILFLLLGLQEAGAQYYRAGYGYYLAAYVFYIGKGYFRSGYTHFISKVSKSKNS